MNLNLEATISLSFYCSNNSKLLTETYTHHMQYQVLSCLVLIY